MAQVFDPTPENLSECRRLLADLGAQTQQLQSTLQANQATLAQSLGESLSVEELLKVTQQLSDVTQSARGALDALEIKTQTGG